jgi:Anti-sigma factor NepR
VLSADHTSIGGEGKKMNDKPDRPPQMQPTVTKDNAAQTTPLPPEIQNQLGKQLRQVYGKMLAEPMPDKFAQLLQQLAKTEQKS